jgi:hypothetical protein
MSIIESCENNWQALPPSERYALLEKIQQVSPKFDTEGKGIRVLSFVDDYNDLPADIRGRLIFALTETGFDITEYTRSRGAYIGAVKEFSGEEDGA